MLWNDPLRLGPVIGALDPVQFANLCNQLLSVTARSNSIPLSCIATNLRTSEPDGGIDARCVSAPKKVGQLIPRANVIYQFKSGDENKSAVKIAREDIWKEPRVKEALSQKKTLVYMAGWDRGDKFSADVIAKAKEKHGLDITGQFIFLGRDTIAHLLSPFPALAANYLNIDLGSMIGIERWGRQQNFTNPFQTNPELTAQMDELRSLIEAPGSRVRIVGSAGDGKTRRVLEALKDSWLNEAVLYSEQVSDLPPSFINQMQRPESTDTQCVFVVDEVNDADEERLDRQFSTMPSGVRLVMIGLDASGRAPVGTYQVQGLDVDLLAATISSIVPGLVPDEARAIADECEGSPKLAVLIARRIQQESSLTSNRLLLADGSVQKALDRYLGIEDTSPSWRALSVIALLARLGWAEPMAHESERLFEAAGLPVVEARGHIESLHKRMGVAPMAGKYRYVSPSILANHLAARQLDLWPRDSLLRLFQALTPEMQESFAIRARRVSHVLKNSSPAVEEVILGSQGPFRTLYDLESSGASSLIRHFAAPFPVATLRALERIIEQSTPDELRAATRSRRDCVWALEQLLWPITTFGRSASLLLKLALAENETWGNNASNIWASTFQTQLGRTSAGLAPRVKAIREAALSSEPRARALAAGALKAAFNMGHAHRTGGPPKEFEGMPEESWLPATWGEWTEAYFDYLEILSPLLSDSDGTVSNEALKALALALEAALKLPRSSNIPQSPLEGWLSTARSFVGAPFEQREPLIDAVERQRALWKHQLSEQEKELAASARERWDRQLQQLAEFSSELQGSDFPSRFRAALTRTAHPWSDDDAETQGKQMQRELESLAAEVLAQPEILEEQWPWMLAVEQAKQWFIWHFFEALGRLDHERTFAPKLLEVATHSPQATMWHSMYHRAWAAAASAPDYIDKYLGALHQEKVPVGIIFDLALRAGYSAPRIALVRAMIRDEELPLGAVASLAYHPWGGQIPVESVRELINEALYPAATSAPANATPLVGFLHGYLHQKKDAKELLRAAALEVLSLTSEGVAADEWAWTQLARLYVEDEPLELSIAALRQMKRADIYLGGQFRELLQEAWKSGDKQELFEQAIAPALSFGEDDKYTVELWTVREALKGFPFEEAGAGFLMGWVRASPGRRVLALAEALGAPGDEFSDLHAALLADYAEEGVASAFYAAFSTGSWVGDMTHWLQGKIDLAAKWAQDERPAVRDWAQRALASLKTSYREAQEREAEEMQMRKHY